MVCLRAGDLDLGRQAASLAYSSPVEPYYKLDEAQVIVSLDCDFIGSEENAHGQHPAVCQRTGAGGQGRR